ncbi:MAG: S9 family peptidase, partial [Cyanobacteria bacterium J06649_4]
MIQPAQDTWQTPPEPIATMLNVPPLPVVAFSPNAEWIVELGRAGLPDIEKLAEPKVAIAGLQINPKTWDSARATHYRSISIRRRDEKECRPVALPDKPRIRHLQWSYCGQYLSFTHTEIDLDADDLSKSGLSLWILDLEKAEAKRLTEPILNATSGSVARWFPDKTILCKTRVLGDGPPTEKTLPPGPIIEENLGTVAPARTYTNLLENPHDEALLEYYLTSQLVRVSFSGEQTPVAQPAMYRSVSVSPDGQWIKASITHRPFSYQVPIARFPRRTDIFDLQGKSVYTVADLPLAEEIPINFDSVRAGIRASGWRADAPATVYWVEALDGGDARIDSEYRDAVYTLSAPFVEQPTMLWKSQLRFNSLVWGDDKTALAYEAMYNTRQVKTWKLDPSSKDASPKLLEVRNFQDAYAHPGEPMMTSGKYSWQTLLISPGGDLYLNGRGASAEGVYPFLDRFNLSTGEKERLWQSPEGGFSRVSKLLDSEAKQFIVRREDKTTPGNYWLHSEENSAPVALTQFVDPLPWYRDIHKEIVRYSRGDGLELSGTLYLPPGYDAEKDGPLPTLLWVYPEEHKSRETASQVTRAEDTFGRPSRSS